MPLCVLLWPLLLTENMEKMPTMVLICFFFILLVRTLIFQFCGKLYILKSLKLVSLSDEYIDSPKHQRRITKAATKMASLSLKNIAVD